MGHVHLVVIKYIHNRSLIDNRDLIAESEDFIEIRGNKQYRASLTAQVEKNGVHFLGAADVQAPGGLSGDHHLRLVTQLPGYYQLLLVSPG